VRHVVLVSGYATIFILVVVFLPWFQVEDHSFHWSSLLGYYASAALLGATGWMMADRLAKRGEMHRFSQFSDWLFPGLLFLAALTGVLLNVFRLLDRPMPTYVMYAVHLAVVVPMLVVEVPFGKWAHLLYRPLAIYVVAVKGSALESE
jgi:nitrate reductase gamma subunit